MRIIRLTHTCTHFFSRGPSRPWTEDACGRRGTCGLVARAYCPRIASLSRISCVRHRGGTRLSTPRACREDTSHMLGRFAPQSTHSVSRRETRAGGLLARACMSSGAIISAPRPALGPRGGSHRVEVSLGSRLRGGRGSRRLALGLCTRGWREREAGSQRAAREACRGVAARRRRRREGRHPSRSERGREVRLEHRRRERRRERRSEGRREGRRALGRLEARPGALDREVELGMKLLLHEVAHAPRRLDGPRRLQGERERFLAILF